MGFCSARLQRIDLAMERYITQRKLAGTVTLVARHGQVVHFASQGMMDLDSGKPMEWDTIFRIYSMTKPITSLALMMLYEEGRFHLSDSVTNDSGVQGSEGTAYR
jgi:CubicO group peptidase (beta-lactamase class C family)